MAVNNAWEGEADHDALLFAWIFGGSQRQPHASPPEHHRTSIQVHQSQAGRRKTAGCEGNNGVWIITAEFFVVAVRRSRN